MPYLYHPHPKIRDALVNVITVPPSSSPARLRHHRLPFVITGPDPVIPRGTTQCQKSVTNEQPDNGTQGSAVPTYRATISSDLNGTSQLALHGRVATGLGVIAIHRFAADNSIRRYGYHSPCAERTTK